jgi:hypothetical protein
MNPYFRLVASERRSLRGFFPIFRNLRFQQYLLIKKTRLKENQTSQKAQQLTIKVTGQYALFGTKALPCERQATASTAR